MAEVVKMPKMSDTMTEGVLAKWHKKVGDKVKSGDVLAEIETDKATMDFESYQDGTLLYIGVEEGKAVPVDAVIGVIGKEGEDYKAALNAEGAPAAAPAEEGRTVVALQSSDPRRSLRCPPANGRDRERLLALISFWRCAPPGLRGHAVDFSPPGCGVRGHATFINLKQSCNAGVIVLRSNPIVYG